MYRQDSPLFRRRTLDREGVAGCEDFLSSLLALASRSRSSRLPVNVIGRMLRFRPLNSNGRGWPILEHSARRNDYGWHTRLELSGGENVMETDSPVDGVVANRIGVTPLGELAAIRALAPEIIARSREFESARRIPADVSQKLARAGLFRIC